MNPYGRALLRYWWLLIFGAACAGVVGITLLYRVEFGVPPKLKARSPVMYTAATELLVDNATGPYIRTSTREITEQPATRTARPRPTASGTATKGNAQPAQPAPTATTPLETTILPDRKSLVDAANLYPLLIESDEIASIRTKLVGDIAGTVAAKALYSVRGANRFRPSPLPVLQIAATARGPKAARKLAEGTADAFLQWLAQEQKKAKIPPRERIIVRPLRAAGPPLVTGGRSYATPLLAAVVLFGAFAALAITLGRSPAAARPSTPQPSVQPDAELHQVLDQLDTIIRDMLGPANGRAEAAELSPHRAFGLVRHQDPEQKKQLP